MVTLAPALASNPVGSTPAGFGSRFSNSFLGGLPSVIMNALTGGGMIGASVGGLAGGALGTVLGTGGGALSGMAIGSILPGIGTALGALGGGLLGKLFGPSKGAIEGKQADASIGQLQQQLLGVYGSLSSIKQMGGLVGVSLAEAWGSKNVAGLEHFRNLAKQFESQMDRLQSALEKYGLTWEDLGEKAKQFFLEAEAENLLKDYQLLNQAGVDQTRLLEKMAASFSNLAQTAMRNSLDIPNAMRPMMDQLAQMGMLLDQAGNGIENLDNLFRNIDVPEIEIPVTYRPTNAPDDFVEMHESSSLMNGGPVASWRGVSYAPLGGFMRGTDSVLAALTPGEFVMNREAVKRIGGDRLHAINRGAAAGGGPTIVVNIDARDALFDGISADRWADRAADRIMQRAGMRGVRFAGVGA
jgi:hypothetical protein